MYWYTSSLPPTPTARRATACQPRFSQVVSLALPPPPVYVPVLGWSTPAPACGPNASAGLGHGKVHGVNDAASARDLSVVGNVSSPPLLLFPTPATTATFGAEEGARGSGDLRGKAGGCVGFQGSSRGVATLRGRGVIKATRDGRALLLDTHPLDAPPSPPPSPPPRAPAIAALSPPPPPPLLPPCAQARTLPPRYNAEGFSLSVAEERHPEDSRGRCASGSSPIPAECTPPGKTATGDGRLLPPLAGVQGLTGGPAAAGNFTRHVSGAPGAPEVNRGKHKWAVPTPVLGPVRGPILGPAVGVAALPTLGEMCKRGVLVRASRRITCMSVVGVKFAKVTTWCRNCGMVSDQNATANRFIIQPSKKIRV